jgi:toxin ParE1/3/4
VARFRFSPLAASDLKDIVEFTIRNWDERQATRYLDRLETAVQRLSEIETLGRRCDHIRPGLWRAEEGSHVIFFRRDADGLLVCRVLHYRMLPEYQTIDDDE